MVEYYFTRFELLMAEHIYSIHKYFFEVTGAEYWRQQRDDAAQERDIAHLRLQVLRINT